MTTIPTFSSPDSRHPAPRRARGGMRFGIALQAMPVGTPARDSVRVLLNGQAARGGPFAKGRKKCGEAMNGDAYPGARAAVSDRARSCMETGAAVSARGELPVLQSPRQLHCLDGPSERCPWCDWPLCATAWLDIGCATPTASPPCITQVWSDTGSVKHATSQTAKTAARPLAIQVRCTRRIYRSRNL
jgi:hypothetical protein